MKIEEKAGKVVLRQSVFADCHLFNEWEEQEYIRQFFSINDNRDYEEITKEFVLRSCDESKIQMTILARKEDVPIGRIYISRYDRQTDSADITRIYIGEKDYLGKGYGRDSMEAVLQYLFDELKLERVTLDFFEENLTAKGLYEQMGFQPEGIFRHGAKKNGRYYNLCGMSLLRDEYYAGAGK